MWTEPTSIYWSSVGTSVLPPTANSPLYGPSHLRDVHGRDLMQK